MKALLTTLLALTLVPVASAQSEGLIRTHPTRPSREALDRLNLSVAWHARLKLRERPDGIRSLQLLAGADRMQIALQSLDGTVFLVDAQTGDVLWSTPVGAPYTEGKLLAFNEHNIFAFRKNLLYVLDRRNGRHRLYTVDKGGRLDLGYPLPGVPSATPIAVDKFLYLPFSNRAVAYQIPLYEASELFAREEYGALFKVSSAQPEQVWGMKFPDIYFTFPPVRSGEQISYVTERGLLSLNRYNGDDRFEFNATARLAAPVGQHENIAYVPSGDGVLYAVNMTSGRLLWRNLGPSAITKEPYVTDSHVFVFHERNGLAMLDRSSGVEEWRSRDAASFLTHSDRFVYVMDRVGKLLVLDIRRGTALGQYDLSDWQVRVPNEYTDRIFLANHDGQMLCLYPRGSVASMITKTVEIEKKEPEKIDKKEPMEKEKDKDAEKKDEDKKDADKKDAEKKDAEKKDAEKKDLDKKDADIKGAEKKDAKAAWLRPLWSRPERAIRIAADRRRFGFWAPQPPAPCPLVVSRTPRLAEA